LKFDRENSRINIIKKNDEGKKLISTYFKYSSLDNKINFNINRSFNKDGEGVDIEEVRNNDENFDWWKEGVSLRELKKNLLSAYFKGNKILNKKEYYYDRIGNKLYESQIYNFKKRKNKTRKNNFIFK
jgi:hypothetical protein